jgi:putative membrane protein
VTPPHWSSFTFEPLFAVAAVGAGVLYVRAARRTGIEPWRAIVFTLGLLLVALPVNSPLETLAAHYLLLAHLLQNALMADWAPPLLILGLSPAMRSAIASRLGTVLETVTRARIALPAWLVAWYGVHVSAFYDFALRHPWALNIEHGILVAAGLAFWWPVLAREQRTALAPPGALAYLAAAFASATFLGLALTFISTPFYSFYEQAPRLWGISAVKDQNLGGILMNGEQSIVFIAALGYVFFLLLEEEEDGEDGAPAPT